jgi:hypothetical protein
MAAKLTAQRRSLVYTNQHTVTLVQLDQMTPCFGDGFYLDGLFVCHVGYMMIIDGLDRL